MREETFRSKMKKEIDGTELKECTFAPNIRGRQGSQSATRKQQSDFYSYQMLLKEESQKSILQLQQ